MRKNLYFSITLLVLLILNLIIALASIAVGSVSLPLSDVLSGLFGKSADGSVNVIVSQLRLPRMLGALLGGAAFSVAGLLLQSVTSNELCAPNIIGVNSGAGFFVMILLCLFPALSPALPLFAFAGAIVVSFCVLSIASVSSSDHVSANQSLILTGVAVSAFMSAGISYLSLKCPDVLSSYTAFSVGGFSGVYMKDIALPSVIILLCLVSAAMLSPSLNLLCLGEEMASSLGVRVRPLRVLSIVCAAALCAAAVSYAGLIGFVGLVVPHIARTLVGTDTRRLVPVSALTGSALLMLSDLLGRVIAAPGEIPCGIITSFMGAPFFIFLLLRKRRSYDQV